MEKYKEWIKKNPGITFLLILVSTFLAAVGLCVAPSIAFLVIAVLLSAILLWNLVMLMVDDRWDW